MGTKEAGGRCQNHGQARGSLAGELYHGWNVLISYPIEALIFLFPPLPFLQPLCMHLLPSWARSSARELLWIKALFSVPDPSAGICRGASFGRHLAPPWTTLLAQASPALTAQEEKKGKPYLYRWPAILPSIPKLSATLLPPDSTHITCDHWVRQLLLRGVQVKHSIKAAAL